MDEEQQIPEDHLKELQGQLDNNKNLAKALDENPAAVSNAITHIAIGKVFMCMAHIENKLNFLVNKEVERTRDNPMSGISSIITP